MGSSLAVKSRGYPLAVVPGLQGVCASVAVLHGPAVVARRLNSCAAWV